MTSCKITHRPLVPIWTFFERRHSKQNKNNGNNNKEQRGLSMGPPIKALALISTPTQLTQRQKRTKKQRISLARIYSGLVI